MFALLVLVPACFVATACSCADTQTAKVMTVDCNPQVEFILDKNDKVVTVNALNDEGNHIISIVAKSDQTFEDITADEAVELFLKVTKENGYLISAESNSDALKISISGDAEKLKEQVQTAAKNYLETAGITLNVDLGNFNKDAIEAQVKACMQEFKDSELEAMSEEELIALLEESRKETKELLTQELKDMYYQLRNNEMNQARLDAIKTQLATIKDNATGLIKTAIETIEGKIAEFETQITNLKTSYNEQFLSQTSEYNQKMQEFITAKKELLEARLEGANTTTLALTVSTKETALNIAKTTANSVINGINTAINTALTIMETSLSTVSSLLNQANIDTAVANAKAEFKADFSTEFSAYVGNNSYWAQLEISVGE